MYILTNSSILIIIKVFIYISAYVHTYVGTYVLYVYYEFYMYALRLILNPYKYFIYMKILETQLSNLNCNYPLIIHLYLNIFQYFLIFSWHFLIYKLIYYIYLFKIYNYWITHFNPVFCMCPFGSLLYEKLIFFGSIFLFEYKNFNINFY